MASISGSGDVTRFGLNSTIDDNVADEGYDGEAIPALPFYIAINTTNPDYEVKVSELRLKKQDLQNEPFLKYKYTNQSLKPKFFRIDHAGPIYAHYSCCKSDCTRQTFHRISGI